MFIVQKLLVVFRIESFQIYLDLSNLYASFCVKLMMTFDNIDETSAFMYLFY